MRQQIIEYTTPIDALAALVRQLSTYENQYQMDSADFLRNIAKVRWTMMKYLLSGQVITSTF
jgi:hypothetical protein